MTPQDADRVLARLSDPALLERVLAFATATVGPQGIGPLGQRYPAIDLAFELGDEPDTATAALLVLARIALDSLDDLLKRVGIEDGAAAWLRLVALHHQVTP